MLNLDSIANAIESKFYLKVEDFEVSYKKILIFMEVVKYLKFNDIKLH